MTTDPPLVFNRTLDYSDPDLIQLAIKCPSRSRPPDHKKTLTSDKLFVSLPNGHQEAIVASQYSKGTAHSDIRVVAR